MSEQLVYVMVADGSPELVKVGCSVDPQSRLMAMRTPAARTQVDHEGPYRIVFTMRGGRVVERAAHEALAHRRACKHHRVEWFIASADDAIEALLRAAWSERHTVEREWAGGSLQPKRDGKKRSFWLPTEVVDDVREVCRLTGTTITAFFQHALEKEVRRLERRKMREEARAN